MGSVLPLGSGTEIGRRSNSRLRLNLPACLVLVDGQWSCILENVSRTGARVVIGQFVKPGSVGFLRCQDLELFGAVVWCREQRCGLMFDQLLVERDLMSLRWLGDHHKELDADRQREDVREWVGGKRRHL